MPRSASGKSARSARTSRSARSVYSTPSHLLSPGTTNESSETGSPRTSASNLERDGPDISPTPDRLGSHGPKSSQSRSARITSPNWQDRNQNSPSFSPLLFREDEQFGISSTGLPSSWPSGPQSSSTSQRYPLERSTASRFGSPRSSSLGSSVPKLETRPSTTSKTSASDLVSSRSRSALGSKSSGSFTTYTSNRKKSKTTVLKPRQSSSRSSQRSVSSSHGSGRKRYSAARSVPSTFLHSSTVSTSPSVQSLPRSPRSIYSSTQLNALEVYRQQRSRANVNADQRDTYGQDTLTEVIMAIDMDKNGKVGCAYYSAIDETLFIEEDIAMGGVEMLETLLLHVEPTSVFVSNRAPGTLVEFAERDAHRYDEDETSNGEQGSYILRHLQSVRFDYEIAKEIMVGIDLEQYEPDPIQIDSPEEERVQNIGSDSHNKLIHLGKIINFDSCLSIGCAGAVLSDLERRRNAENPNPGDEDDTSFRVKEIVMNSSADTMLISADSLMSLQITHSELHPNPHMQCPRGSEPTASKSLSVIGLIQSLASTAQGKRRLRQILLRPSTSINLIQERQIAIGILLRSKNAETANSMRKTLRKLKDTKALLLHVKKGVDRVRGELSIRIRDWEALLRFVMVTVNIGQAVDMLEGAQQVAVFTRIREEIDTSQFIVLSKVIMETFDFDASKTSGHTEIRPTASDCLSELRSEYEQLMSLLPELKQTQLNEVPKWAHKYILDCSISRQLGFLVRVTPDPETGEGMYHGKDEDEWEKILVNETGVFYATRYMNELRSQYGDLISSILDEEIALILDASQMVREYEEDIVRALELYGELDSLLAFAAAAEKYNWVPPRMTTSNVVYIVDGRHPLQELLVPAFIPNSCSLEGGNGMARPGSEEYEERQQSEIRHEGSESYGSYEGYEGYERYNGVEEYERHGMVPSENLSSQTGGCGDKKATMLILTGPNNSGKSIYMKQVALIVYLAHTGCYVPATQATIGLTDRILTRISTRETSVDDESAFMTDIKQAAFSMNFATRRSLLLLDEFGKGTTAGNGAGLLTAYLMHLLDLEAERPKVLVGTHLHEIFEPNFLESREGVELAHMEVLINKEAEDIEDQITFLHRLLPGRDPKSLGIMCAEICGFAPDFLDLADDLVEVMDKVGPGDLVPFLKNAAEEYIEARTGRKKKALEKFMAIPESELENADENLMEMMQEIADMAREDNFVVDWEREPEARETYDDAEWYDPNLRMGSDGHWEYISNDEDVEEVIGEFDDEGPLNSADAMDCDDDGEEWSSSRSGFSGFGGSRRSRDTGSMRTSDGTNPMEDSDRRRGSNGTSEFHGFGSLDEMDGLDNWDGTAQLDGHEEIRNSTETPEFQGFGSWDNNGGMNCRDPVTPPNQIGGRASQDPEISDDAMDWSSSVDYDKHGGEDFDDAEDLEDTQTDEVMEGLEYTRGENDIQCYEDLYDYEDRQGSVVSFEEGEGSGHTQHSRSTQGSRNTEEVFEDDQDSEEYEDSEIFEGFEGVDGSTDFEGFGSSPGGGG